MRYKTKHLVLIVGLIALGVLLTAGITGIISAEQEYRKLFREHTQVFAPPVPAQASFAGEKVPLDIYSVRESFEREILVNTYMHASTILMFKRASRWFPVIEPILKANNIPDDFKFLALAESNFSHVVSSAGAEGFWQFIKPTGQKYGLEITEEVDERYNVEKSTEAACKYFREAYSRWNNWTLVAASYNRGMEGLARALENQKVNGYYDLYLNDETARYVFRILAMKEIYNYPVRYGYYLRYSDFYPLVPTYAVPVDTSISDLADFAKKNKSTYRVLREFNPWIRRYNLPNKAGKTYVFQFPKEGYLKVENLMKILPPGETFFHDSLKIKEMQ